MIPITAFNEWENTDILHSYKDLIINLIITVRIATD